MNHETPFIVLSADRSEYSPEGNANRRAAALKKLKDSEVLALAAWAAAKGAHWKKQLFAAWEVAGMRVSDYTPTLQLIRNRHGASVVNNITTKELQAEAEYTKRVQGMPA